VRRSLIGWEYVHVAIGRPGHRVHGDRRTRSRGIDDATRLAYVEVLEDERAARRRKPTAVAIAHFAAFGIRVERLMTDNGNAYRSAIH